MLQDAISINSQLVSLVFIPFDELNMMSVGEDVTKISRRITAHSLVKEGNENIFKMHEKFIIIKIGSFVLMLERILLDYNKKSMKA